ncbi:MAG: tetratricopeptide repeat protein [Candidatus Aegiribacteria sp.]|nr:tetratricopeptide repeat protein [Candidatus Aegiribacteria sp.]
MTCSTDRKDPETLERMLSGTEELERIGILADLCVAFRGVNSQKVIEYGIQGLELLGSVEDKELESAILKELCWAKQCLGEYQAALDYGLRKLEIDEDRDKSSALNIVGVTYWRMGKYDKALECYLKALNILEDSGDNSGTAPVLNNIGIIYNTMGDRKKALDYYNKSIKICEELDDKKGLANSFNNAGNIYRKSGESDKALKYYQKALKIRENSNDKRGFSHTLTNIGTVYQDLKKFDKSLEYFLRSLRIEEETEDRLALVNTLLSVSIIYASTDRFSEALEYVRRGFDFAEEIGAPDLKRDCCATFSSVLEQKGDFREALYYHKKCKALNDEIFNEDSSARINELQVQYETEKKEKEKEIYRLRNIELAKANEDLKRALNEVKQLSRLLPICASCKKIRDDHGYWKQIESYISDHSEAQFSHGLCPECMMMLYPELSDNNKSIDSVN